jgi:penicillin amidase
VEVPEPFRAARIWELIGQRGGLGPDDVRRMQADTVSLHAKAVLPLLLARVQRAQLGATGAEALELLRRWDFDARGDSAAAAIFQAWFLQLTPVIVGDELGARALDAYNGRYSYVTRFLVNTLRSSDNIWCDRVGTPDRETCDDAVTMALGNGLAALTRTLSGTPASWRWEAAHTAVFPHQGFDTVGLLRRFFSRSIPSAGDWSTINVGAVDVDHPFEQREIAGYRQIIDLSAGNDSRFLDAVGQSGHFLSPLYDDALQSWSEVQHRRMRMDRAEIERDAAGRLRLVPPES